MLQGQSCEQLLCRFQSMSKDGMQEQLEKELEKIERELAQKLKGMLTKAAENCGMAMRSAGPNVSLMGTTYSGILYFETGEEVFTLTVQAGDSLALAFVPEREGGGGPMLSLRALLPPQEREDDGGLDNCIDVNHDFYLRCAFHAIPKPCMLMVASDGCFDAFPSMLHFEHFILKKLCSEESIDLSSAVRQMYRHFANGASSDDSSTMAVCAFGMNFGQDSEAPLTVCGMASRRLEKLEKEYGRLNPGSNVLENGEESREKTMQQINLKENEVLRGYRDRFWGSTEWIRQYCERQLAASAPEEFERINAQTRTAVSAIEQEINAKTNTILAAIHADWLSLRKNVLSDECNPDTADGQRRGLLAYIGNRRDAAVRTIRQCSLELDGLKAQLSENAACIERAAGRYAALCKAAASENENNPDALSDALNELKELNREIIRTLKDKDDWEDRLRQARELLLSEERPQIYLFFRQILNRDEQALMLVSAEDQERLRDLLQQIDALEKEKDGLNFQKAARISDAAKKLYSERPLTYMRRCLEENPENTDQTLMQEIREKLNEIRDEYRPQLEKQAQTQELMERYRHEYESIMCLRR